MDKICSICNESKDEKAFDSLDEGDEICNKCVDDLYEQMATGE